MTAPTFLGSLEIATISFVAGATVAIHEDWGKPVAVVTISGSYNAGHHRERRFDGQRTLQLYGLAPKRAANFTSSNLRSTSQMY
jgi:hypothetical protein